MNKQALTFFFPICGYCCASDDDCDMCEGTGFDPLPEQTGMRDPVIVGNGSMAVLTPIALPDHMFPPPRPTAELADVAESGVYLMDGKGRIRHIAAA